MSGPDRMRAVVGWRAWETIMRRHAIAMTELHRDLYCAVLHGELTLAQAELILCVRQGGYIR